MKKTIVLGSIVLFNSIAHAQFWKVSEPETLPSTVNSAAEEGTPIFSADNSALYFTRTFDLNNVGGELDQDIWFSQRDADGKYSKAKNIKELNNKFNNAVMGVNTAGNRLYVLNSYDGKKDTKKGLDVVERASNGDWGKPKKIDIPDLDIEGDFYGFHVTPDEKTIIISYNGPNTIGEEDLYVSELVNGKWTSPLHMGNTINSSGFEMSPFLSPNKDTLYFSSNGMGGLGDADIFYSVKQGTWTQWSTPQNMGKPFNSDKFDAYFSYNGQFAYWASNRDNQRSNIYKVEILTPPALAINCSATNVTVYDGSNGTATANINDGIAPYTYKWSNGDTQQTARNLVAGTYTVEVTDNLGQQATCEVTITQPAKPVLELIADEIYYDLNSSFLNAENKATLDKLVSQLKERSELKIIVESHCDIRASAEYNIELSQRRMNRTINYLIENGIDKKRITGEYKGKNKPKIDCGENCTEEQHRINRRTTITTSL
jgi:outer membrane protein OmpA-like peptidoglycan-associated protein